MPMYEPRQNWECDKEILKLGAQMLLHKTLK